MLPQVLLHAVQQASAGEFRVRVEQSGVEELRREMQVSARRRDKTMVGAATLLGGIVWLAVSMNPWPGVVLCAAGLLAVVIGRR
jgi:hypothetical protein